MLSSCVFIAKSFCTRKWSPSSPATTSIALYLLEGWAVAVRIPSSRLVLQAVYQVTRYRQYDMGATQHGRPAFPVLFPTCRPAPPAAGT